MLLDQGGKEIQKESTRYVKKHGTLEVGTAAVTLAGALDAKYIVHVAGPRWGEKKEVQKVRE